MRWRSESRRTSPESVIVSLTVGHDPETETTFGSRMRTSVTVPQPARAASAMLEQRFAVAFTTPLLADSDAVDSRDAFRSSRASMMSAIMLLLASSIVGSSPDLGLAATATRARAPVLELEPEPPALVKESPNLIATVAVSGLLAGVVLGTAAVAW